VLGAAAAGTHGIWRLSLAATELQAQWSVDANGAIELGIIESTHAAVSERRTTVPELLWTDLLIAYTLPHRGMAGLHAHARLFSLARIVTLAVELVFGDSTRRLGRLWYGCHHGGFYERSIVSLDSHCPRSPMYRIGDRVCVEARGGFEA
jgi:hypothetical protein